MQSKIKNIFIIIANVFIILIIVVFSLSIFFSHLYEDRKSDDKPIKKNNTLFDLKIKIFNTTNVSGLAREVKNYLKIYELKNTLIGNDSVKINASLIKANPKKSLQAKQLALIIGLDSSMVLFDKSMDTSSFDCVIFLGNDYKLLKPFNK